MIYLAEKFGNEELLPKVLPVAGPGIRDNYCQLAWQRLQQPYLQPALQCLQHDWALQAAIVSGDDPALLCNHRI